MKEITALEILRELVAACPDSLECKHFHHTKSNRHGPTDDCPPKRRYEEALELAQAFISISDLQKLAPN